jgi:ABC-type protease/lipase transport system fused ATPase/permease subunit
VNRFINRTAKSALSVFLITMYPGLGVLQIYDASASFNSAAFIFKAIMFVLAVYIVCTMFDFIRQEIFRLTVDRNRGLWFERLWEWASNKVMQLR